MSTETKPFSTEELIAIGTAAVNEHGDGGDWISLTRFDKSALRLFTEAVAKATAVNAGPAKRVVVTLTGAHIIRIFSNVHDVEFTVIDSEALWENEDMSSEDVAKKIEAKTAGLYLVEENGSPADLAASDKTLEALKELAVRVEDATFDSGDGARTFGLVSGSAVCGKATWKKVQSALAKA